MHYQPQYHLLKDRIILVTGASDGIGREAALTYARYSASVVLVGRNEEKLRGVAQEIEQAGGIAARWFTLDLLTCTPQECQQLAQKSTIHYPALTACCTMPACLATSVRWTSRILRYGSR